MSAAADGSDAPEVRTLPVDLEDACRAVLEANWYPAGYTVPNLATYPYQWLWDSCFHALVWAKLGAHRRALSELRHVFRTQDAAGFVPHVDYEVAPSVLHEFWGRSGSSSITQPPLYGHAIAELVRWGVEVPRELIERAMAGLRFLLQDRRRDDASGLVTIVHPWESGADDSPRWDHWAGPAFELASWYDRKGELVAAIERSELGSPISNLQFGAAPSGFNALVAFNALELASVCAGRDRDELTTAATALAAALDDRWDDDLGTWVDAGPSSGTSGRIRTLEGLLPLLVERDERRADRVLRDLLDPAAYGAPCGPRGVHRDEPVHAPDTYWRGPAWPQLSYLVWVAATRHGAVGAAADLGTALVEGARRSGFAEYWNAETGSGLGARPQSWATLALLTC